MSMTSARLPYFHDGWPRFWGFGPASRAATGELWFQYFAEATGAQTITGSFAITVQYKGVTTHVSIPPSMIANMFSVEAIVDSGVLLDDTTSPLRIAVSGYSCPQYDAAFNTPPCFGPQGDFNYDSGSYGDIRGFSVAAFIGDPHSALSKHFQATKDDGSPYQD